MLLGRHYTNVEISKWELLPCEHYTRAGYDPCGAYFFKGEKQSLEKYLETCKEYTYVGAVSFKNPLNLDQISEAEMCRLLTDFTRRTGLPIYERYIKFFKKYPSDSLLDHRRKFWAIIRGRISNSGQFKSLLQDFG